jgi:uncharacterized protein (TIGR03067 family)
MKNILMIVLCGAAILAAGCSTLRKSDADVLQGTWMGQEIRGGTGRSCQIIISGNNLEFRGESPNDWCKGTYTLREDTNPKQIIGVISDCPSADQIGKKVYAIYRIEAGTLILTGNPPGSTQEPASFEAPHTRKMTLKKG